MRCMGKGLRCFKLGVGGMVEKMGRRIRRRGLEAAGYGGNDVQRSVGKIHLPQTLSEEPTGDELSDWEQVSF